MLSTCVLFEHKSHFNQFTAEELNSLRYLYYKFDLFAADPGQDMKINAWLDAHIEVKRIIGRTTPEAEFAAFDCLDKKEVEWIGNIDVFINCPENLKVKINELFPNRVFIALRDVVNPDYKPEPQRG